MTKLRVLHIATSDISGGAAIASFRIHQALLGHGIDSEMLVLDKSSSHHEIKVAKSAALKPTRIRTYLGYALMRLQKTENINLHSPAIFGSGLIGKINRSNFDIINLHWIQGEFLSVEDIGKISKPLVWTLHDMWAFCGAEHYTLGTRYIEGYNTNNRPNDERGVDLNKWVWNRKNKQWKRPMHIICPSSWLTKTAMSSKLMHNWPITNISYPVNECTFRPCSLSEARLRTACVERKHVILFGAIGVHKDKRKGFDLMVDALSKLGRFLNKDSDITIATFGYGKDLDIQLPFPVVNLGYIADDNYLRYVYCSADVAVVPSRLDNLPQIALESQMSGTPVVAFNIGGLADIVSHLQTGYLARPYDTTELAYGIAWVIQQSDYKTREMSRERALRKYLPHNIASAYNDLYHTILESRSRHAHEIVID